MAKSKIYKDFLGLYTTEKRADFCIFEIKSVYLYK